MLTGSSSFEKCLKIHHPPCDTSPLLLWHTFETFYHFPKWAIPAMPLKNQTPSTFVWIITSQPSPFDGRHWTICLWRMWKGILYKSINLKLVWLTASRPHAIGILFPSAICVFHATLVSTGNNNNILWATYVHAEIGKLSESDCKWYEVNKLAVFTCFFSGLLTFLCTKTSSTLTQQQADLYHPTETILFPCQISIKQGVWSVGVRGNMWTRGMCSILLIVIILW